MKFRIICSGEDDVKEVAESLSKVLTDQSPKPAFSGILHLYGAQDVEKACTFLQSDFEGTTICILDRKFLALTRNWTAFKLFQKLSEYLYQRGNGRIVFINHDVTGEELEEFKKGFEQSDKFVEALVHSTELTEVADYIYRVMRHLGPRQSTEDPVSLPTGIVRNFIDPALDTSNWERMSLTSLQNSPQVSRLPSHYLHYYGSPPDSASGGIGCTGTRGPMEHYCSLSSDSGSAEGSRHPPIGESNPLSFTKGTTRSLPAPTSPNLPKDPVLYRSEPEAGVTPQRIGYIPGQVMGNVNPGQVKGNTNPGQGAGKSPGQATAQGAGYISVQGAGYIPDQATGYNSDQAPRYSHPQVTEHIIHGQSNEQLIRQRVPEQNQEQELEGIPSADIFVSNQMGNYVVPAFNQGVMSANSNDSGNYSILRSGGLQYIGQDEHSSQSEIVSSYVRGDMEHLLCSFGENALEHSLYSCTNGRQGLPSGFCVDCKKNKESLIAIVSEGAARGKEFNPDESLPPYSTFGPTALSGVCKDCSQIKQNMKLDSIPSMESSTVNSLMILSEKLGSNNSSLLSVGSSTSQGSHASQRSSQGQMSQDIQRLTQQQRLPQGQGLNQRQMSGGQRSLHDQMSQGQGFNQRQMTQGQMSQGQGFNQRQISGSQRPLHDLTSQGQGLNQRQMTQGQISHDQRLNQHTSQGQRLNQMHVLQNPSAVQSQMQQIVTGISAIRLPRSRNSKPVSQEQINRIVYAYSDQRQRPNSEQVRQNQTITPNLQNHRGQGLTTVYVDPQNQVQQGEVTPPSQGMRLSQRMVSPQGITSPQGMAFPQIVNSQQRMAPAQRMTSMPAIGVEETEMNLLSSLNGGGGTSRGLHSLPSNLDSQTAGFLVPNIRPGDPDNHSSMQSEIDNRDGEDHEHLSKGTVTPKGDSRDAKNRSRRNPNIHPGRDDGASGGSDPMPTCEAMGAENQVDIHELALPVFEFIRDQLDCSQMYNWRNLADLHGLNYRQIQDIEQLWRNGRINSPFEYLIRTFQRYSVQQLRDDLQKIPRCDILDHLKKLEVDGKLPAGCAGLFTGSS